jgi:hypothetical protein
MRYLLHQFIFSIMDPKSQAFLMIPVSARIQPQSEVCDDPPKQSYSSFFPSFLPTWGSMRTGPGIPPIPENPPSSISEVPPEPDMSDDEMSDGEMSLDKPLTRKVCKYILFRMPRAELLGLLDLNIECRYQ